MNKLINAGKALLNATAGTNPVSAFIATLYNDYFNEQWQERREIWEDTFEKKFKKLEVEIGKDRIRKVSNFASLFASATHAAMTDIEEDKVGLYANAVINVIKNENIDDVKRHIFLNMLRNFTRLHIDMLYFFQNIEQKIKKQNQNKMYGEVRVNNTNWFSCASKYNPETFNNSNLYDLCYAELVSQKLLKHNNIGISDHINEPYPSKQTTKLGDEFLAFITEQEAKND